MHKSKGSENWILPQKGRTIHPLTFKALLSVKEYGHFCRGRLTCGRYGRKTLTSWMTFFPT